MINKFNIAKPEKYQAKDGTEKTMWHNIGTMTEFVKNDGSISRIIEIPAIGLKANIFPFVDKNSKAKVVQNSDGLPQVDVEDEIKSEDLPF